MKQLYYILNELIKSYHVFCKFDPIKAKELLDKINQCRLQMALIADQRQIFYEQIDVEANATGYKNDVFFTNDDIDSLVIRMIADLEQEVTISLTQQGKRENIFTRQSIQWQQLMSQVQVAANNGQKIPFDFPQEIYLGANDSLDIGVTNQQTDGNIFVHGCNLKDDHAPDRDGLWAEITQTDLYGKPRLPELDITPIQFKFTAATVENKAVAVDGGKDIFSIKLDKSVILTEVSTTSVDYRMDLIDNARNQEICSEVEVLGIAGQQTNQFTVYYPLPYPHLLRRKDRFQFRALNGSLITGDETAADTTQTLCFRGFTI